MREEKKAYSKLRPFDLEKAKASALQTWLQNHNRRLTQEAIDEALMEYIAHVEKQRDDLLKIASNFEITGPDEDGLVWLVLPGHGTTGRAMFNFGKTDRLAVQVALHLEADRCAAIARTKGGAA